MKEDYSSFILFLYVLVAIALVFINPILLSYFVTHLSNSIFTPYFNTFLDLSYLDNTEIQEFVFRKEGIGGVSLGTAFYFFISLPCFLIFFLFYQKAISFFFGKDNEIFHIRFNDISVFNLIVLLSYFYLLSVFFPFVFRPLWNLFGALFFGHIIVEYKSSELRTDSDKMKFSKFLSSVQTLLFIIFSCFWFTYFVENFYKSDDFNLKFLFYLVHIILYAVALIIGFQAVKFYDYFIGLNGKSLKSLNTKIARENEIKEEKNKERREKESLRKSEEVKGKRTNEVEKNRSVNINSTKDSSTGKKPLLDGDWNKGLREFQNSLNNQSKADINKLKTDVWVLITKRNRDIFKLFFINSNGVKIVGQNINQIVSYKLENNSNLTILLFDLTTVKLVFDGIKFTGTIQNLNGKWRCELLTFKQFTDDDDLKSFTVDYSNEDEPIVNYKKFSEEKGIKVKPVELIKPQSNLVDYIPISNVTFSVNNKSSFYSYFAIFHYYPVNRFSFEELDEEDLINRSILYKFKDGKNTKFNADLFASALINQH